MSQAIKYETTKVDPTRSASEIAALVQRYGGSRFEMMWDEWGQLTGVRFAIRHERLGEVPVRLMASVERVTAMIQKRRPYSTRQRRTRIEWAEWTKEVAYRVAWRQLKDFVEQALFAVETGLFPLHEAFMAQVETPDPETGEPITVGQLFERHASMGEGGLRLLPAPTVEAQWEEVQ